MRRQLVAGILVHDDRVLLVKNATGDARTIGLWSLPMDDVRENEKHDKALLRVLSETLKPDVCISPKLLAHQNESSEIMIFTISVLCHPSILRGQTVQECDFFTLSDLPEHIAIDSLLCIIKYQFIGSGIGNHPFAIIDRVFASVFYSCLARHFGLFEPDRELEIYRYIVLSTPYRKFKSVVPFLLSRCDHEVSHVFLIPELCFAVWTLLDDCHDETLHRYGRESALSKFGSRASIIALFTSLRNMKRFLDRELPASSSDKIIAALAQSASALLQRSRNSPDTNIETYLDQSAARTEFLRAAWVAVLDKTNYDPAKREMIYEIQRRSSRIGQLVNDYFDIDRGEFRDFNHKVASAHWLLLNREASEDDRDLSRSLWSGSAGGIEKYVALLNKYNIKRILNDMIRESLVGIVTHIQETELDEDEKAVLIAWHQMSFIQFNPRVDDVRLLAPFLDAVETFLCKWQPSHIPSG